MKPQSSASSFLDIAIQDISPVRGERSLGTLRPGINVIRGANGTGKTTVKRLVLAATSSARIKAGDFLITAGAAKGRLTFAGRTLTIERDGGASRKGAAPAVEPVPDHFKTLEDPGFVGADPRADARLRAICTAFDVRPEPEVLRALLPEELGQAEAGAVEDVLRQLERVPPDSVPAGAAKIKAALQKARQNQEAVLGQVAATATIAEDRHARALEHLEADAGDELAEVTDDLPQRLEVARRALDKLEAERAAGEQAAAERRVWQQQLDAVSSDPRPGLREEHQAAKLRWGAAAAGADSAEEQIRQLEAEIARWREKRTTYLGEKNAQAGVIADLDRRIALADHQQANVAELQAKLAAAAPATVSADDVELAESEVTKLERLRGYRERQLRVDQLKAEAAAAEARRADVAEAVEQIDAVDKGVWRRLGELLADRLDGAARVVDGRVEAKGADGEWHDLDSRAFSEGQRAELVLGIMINGAAAGGEVRVVVDEEGDCPIDDDGLRRLSSLAAAKGLAILVEKELAGAELRLEHMGGA